MRKTTDWIWQGIKDGMPICLGYLAVSFTFGIVAKQIGLLPIQATIMSFTNLTSAGQFGALDLILTSAPFLEMALLQLVINLRYSLMSCAISQKLDPKTPLYHRFIMATGITDEIFALSVSVEGKLNPFYTYGMMMVAIPGWFFGTLFGVVLGNVMPLNLLSALSIALYGMFIAIIIPPARKNKIILGLIIISMLISTVFVFTPILREISYGFRIIILTIILSSAAAILFPIKEAHHAS